MNRVATTTIAISLLLLSNGIAGAQTARARIEATPIRGEANLASAVIATLKEGDAVDVVERQGEWYRVLVPNEQGKPRVGFVLANLIEILNPDGSLQTTPAPATTRATRSIGQALGAQAPFKTIEDGVLDHIQIFVSALEQSQNLTVVIRPFETNAADLGTGGKDGKDTRQQESKTMQNEGPRVLSERFVSTLEKSGPFKGARVLKPDEVLPDGALVVEGKFVTLDPGSRAKRYFAGFGAGKSSVKVAGAVKDSTGRTLATFDQRRIGAMGLGGGDSLGKLMSDSQSIGEDIAKFLAKWARGDSLQ